MKCSQRYAAILGPMYGIQSYSPDENLYSLKWLLNKLPGELSITRVSGRYEVTAKSVIKADTNLPNALAQLLIELNKTSQTDPVIRRKANKEPSKQWLADLIGIDPIIVINPILYKREEPTRYESVTSWRFSRLPDNKNQLPRKVTIRVYQMDILNFSIIGDTSRKKLSTYLPEGEELISATYDEITKEHTATFKIRGTVAVE